MGIGQKIRLLRENAGLTQEELAQRIGVTPSAVGNYEHDVSHPRESVLYRMFSALCCEPNDLFADFFDSGADSGFMRRYGALDAQGRQRVDEVLAQEYARCSSHAQDGADADDSLLIAARGNGAPHTIRMKKREDAGSIFDAPDYKGGR